MSHHSAPDLSADHYPLGFGDPIALGFTRALRFCADNFSPSATATARSSSKPSRPLLVWSARPKEQAMTGGCKRPVRKIDTGLRPAGALHPARREGVVDTDAGLQRNPDRTQGIRGKRRISTLHASTPLAAVLAATLAGAPRAHADNCAIDQDQNRIFIQTCVGANGAAGTNGSNFEDGGPGGPGETPGGGYSFGADFPGVPLKPTIAFTGVGGNGGVGGAAGKSTNLQRGGNGGPGGNGWDFDFELTGGQVNDGGNALTPLSIVSAGGNGGAGGSYGNNNNGYGGAGGNGGSGGAVGLRLDPGTAIYSTGAGLPAVLLQSLGGAGGNAQSTATLVKSSPGAPGGAGGGGGTITATLSGVVNSAGAGVQAFSLGGNGGNGGSASSAAGSATGGSGGAGGSSGAIDLTLASAVITATGAAAPATGIILNGQNGSIRFSAPVAAVQVLTTGGIGGQGGGGQGGFGKGAGGSGGSVNASGYVKVAAQGSSIATSGYGAAGILAQSTGGHGGNGGYGGATFVSTGGSGSLGGNAGVVNVAAAGGSITTSGDSSLAIVGQSLGGGGGYGADASVVGAIIGVAVGGDSASGGDANQVVIGNAAASGTSPTGATIVTSGYKSAAILAQSIGGGGGIAGDARSTGFGSILNVAIGGNAGSGGNGGSASIGNDGVVQTSGVDAYGVAAQSIGGGGGTGGAAASLVVGAQLTVAASVGGKGGNGGLGGVADVVQLSQVVTSGTDAVGVLAQSIGGGGGNGGTSVARNIQLYNAQQAPSVNLTVSLGGSGGTGGTSSNALVINSGTVLTSGGGGVAVLAQSIGGGGGTGGDSDALSLLGKGSTVSVTTAIGGVGGKGGNSGTVEVDNSGFIGTLADHASAVMAQSVGGGGGIGGYGNANSGSLLDNDASLQVAIGVGGNGGAGGNGDSVFVKNANGNILTQGAMSFGVIAQSIGGGGGAAGGALANGGGGTKVNLNVGVGGGGGAGGDGAQVSVTNDAAILTRGGGASAITAQSIGGGGGVGGDAALGTGASVASSAASFVKQGFGIGAQTTTTPDGLATVLLPLFSEGKDAAAELKKILDSYEALNPSDPGKEKGTILGQIDANIGGGFAGKGGSAGAGGEIDITNSGTIATDGAFAEGIFAQSIGGGGGNGGAAAVANDTSVINGTLGIGGRGGSSGNAGAVTVTNSGLIATQGDAGFGIYAQSIGGGGGKGGVSAGEPGILTDFNINIGGRGGSNGSSGAVTINQSGSVITAGRDAIGIIGQSIGGGGGLGALMTINTDGGGGNATSHTGYIINRSFVTINIGDAGSTSGHGSAVTVDLNGGGVTTAGVNAYGVLCQPGSKLRAWGRTSRSYRLWRRYCFPAGMGRLSRCRSVVFNGSNGQDFACQRNLFRFGDQIATSGAPTLPNRLRGDMTHP